MVVQCDIWLDLIAALQHFRGGQLLVWCFERKIKQKMRVSHLLCLLDKIQLLVWVQRFVIVGSFVT